MNPDQLLTDKRDLVSWLESGSRPKSEWRMGTEHEKFGFCVDTLKPLPYHGERSVRAVLEGLASQFDWETVYEDDLPIALKKADGCSITLEPGGQLELSGALLDNLHETCNEVNTHLAEVRAVAEPLGVGFLGMGFHPTARREDIDWMPKARYVIMRNYMPKVGSMGHDMMKRTCTVQVNLDFASESRYGRQVPRLAGAAADRHGAVCRFALCRRQAQWIFKLPQPGLDRYRQQPHRHAALGVRVRDGLRTLRGLDAGRADVLCPPRGPLYRRGRKILPRLHGRQIAGPGRRLPTPGRLGRSSDHRVSRSASETFPGNARCRRRPMASFVRSAGILGRLAL